MKMQEKKERFLFEIFSKVSPRAGRNGVGRMDEEEELYFRAGGKYWDLAPRSCAGKRNGWLSLHGDGVAAGTTVGLQDFLAQPETLWRHLH